MPIFAQFVSDLQNGVHFDFISLKTANMPISVEVISHVDLLSIISMIRGLSSSLYTPPRFSLKLLMHISSAISTYPPPSLWSHPMARSSLLPTYTMTKKRKELPPSN